MKRIGVVCPTVTGRSRSLRRFERSVYQADPYRQARVLILRDRATCGLAWQEGADKLETVVDYLWFAADDVEVHPGFFDLMREACDQGMCPTAVVLNPDGSVQSAGIATPDRLNVPAEIVDWAPVGWTTTPFMAVGQWKRWGPMVPLHYCTDMWVSDRARAHGVETVIRADARLTHHMEAAGRGAGMGSEGARLAHDKALYGRYVAGELAA